MQHWHEESVQDTPKTSHTYLTPPLPKLALCVHLEVEAQLRGILVFQKLHQAAVDLGGNLPQVLKCGPVTNGAGWGGGGVGWRWGGAAVLVLCVVK